MNACDALIIGAGPGGTASAINSSELGLSNVVIEKGSRVFQGIIDSYPREKKVYPTIPKGQQGPFPIDALAPRPDSKPVEAYIDQIEVCVGGFNIQIHVGEDFQDVTRRKDMFVVADIAERLTQG